MTQDESQVSVGVLLALDQVLEFLGHVELFWDFESRLKEECKKKWRSRDLGPLLDIFWFFGNM